MDASKLHAAMTGRDDTDPAEEAEGAEDPVLSPEMLDAYAPVLELVEHNGETLTDQCEMLDASVGSETPPTGDLAVAVATAVAALDEEFAAALTDTLAEAPWDDVLALAKHVVGEGFVDCAPEVLAGFLFHGARTGASA